MARKAPQAYRVVREADGGIERSDLSLADARREAAMLNGQACVVTVQRPAHRDEHGQTTRPALTEFGSMHLGQRTVYVVASTDGIVLP